MAFLLWSKDERKKVRDANPELKSADIAVKLGEAWHKLSEDARRPYVAKAAENRAAKRAMAAKDVDAAVREQERKSSGGSKKHKHRRDRSASPSPPPREAKKKKSSSSKKKKKEKRRSRSDSESETDSDGSE